ncbi:unnamed protein product [Aspergillus oryzae]|nr:unnamed protein product [Aspergillus oryzae]GMF88609.1 unnamed protein product [Aspergillus oryzae]GMG06765.1 unnamed protein product [Aspergillus oryzae]
MKLPPPIFKTLGSPTISLRLTWFIASSRPFSSPLPENDTSPTSAETLDPTPDSSHQGPTPRNRASEFPALPRTSTSPDTWPRRERYNGCRQKDRIDHLRREIPDSLSDMGSQHESD